MHWWDGPRTLVRDGVSYHAISPLIQMYGVQRRSIEQALVFALCCLRLVTKRFDVIEADHMPYIQLATLKLVALIRRKRLVVTWHEYWGPEYWREYLGPPVGSEPGVSSSRWACPMRLSRRRHRRLRGSSESWVELRA